MPPEQSYPTEPFEIFLDYDHDVLMSTNRPADANELATWIKSEISEHEIAGVECGFGKVTVLLYRHQTHSTVAVLKAVIQKWMKYRGHRGVRAAAEGTEAEISFPAW
jgi:hypothetical protein